MRFILFQIKRWGLLVLGLLLLAMLVNRISWHEFVDTLNNAEPLYIGAALLSGIFVTFFRTARYNTIFPTRGRWLHLYGVFSSMRLVKLIIPANLGEFAYLYALKKHGFSPSIAENIPVWIFIRACDLAIMALFLALAGGFWSHTQATRGGQWGMLGLFVFIVLMLVFLPIIVNTKVAGKSVPKSWLMNRLQKIRLGIRHIQSFYLLFISLIWSVGVWVCMGSMAMFAQVAFSTPLSLGQCFVAAILAQSISFLPINAPLGIGTDDLAWTAVLTFLGVEFNVAICLAIAIRLIVLSVLLIDASIGFCVLWLCNHRNGIKGNISS